MNGYTPPVGSPKTDTPTKSATAVLAATELPLPHAGLAALTGGQTVRQWLAAEQRYAHDRTAFSAGAHVKRPVVVTPREYHHLPDTPRGKGHKVG